MTTSHSVVLLRAADSTRTKRKPIERIGKRRCREEMMMSEELVQRPLDRRVIRRSLVDLLRLGPYQRPGTETRATMEEAAEEIERLREDIGRLLQQRAAEGDRLDWLLARLPGNVIRDIVGVMSNTRSSSEWRELIDKAAGFKPYNT